MITGSGVFLWWRLSGGLCSFDVLSVLNWRVVLVFVCGMILCIGVYS